MKSLTGKNPAKLIISALLALSFSLPVSADGSIEDQLLQSALAAGREEGALPSQMEEKAGEQEKLILLTWQEDPESVRYEVEIFRGLPENLDRNSPVENHLYDNQRIYTNQVLVDLSTFPPGEAPSTGGCAPLTPTGKAWVPSPRPWK